MFLQTYICSFCNLNLHTDISINIRCLLAENKSTQGVKDANTASEYTCMCLCNKYFRLICDMVSPLRAISPSATFGKHKNFWQTLHQIRTTYIHIYTICYIVWHMFDCLHFYCDLHRSLMYETKSKCPT